MDHIILLLENDVSKKCEKMGNHQTLLKMYMIQFVIH